MLCNAQNFSTYFRNHSCEWSYWHVCYLSTLINWSVLSMKINWKINDSFTSHRSSQKKKKTPFKTETEILVIFSELFNEVRKKLSKLLCVEVNWLRTSFLIILKLNLIRNDKKYYVRVLTVCKPFSKIICEGLLKEESKDI